MNTRDDSNLDFLRAMAVLVVVAAHMIFFFGIVSFGPLNLMPLGLLGVLIFFVHTSFVLMLSLERQWNQSKNDLFFVFMARRCFRILPLSILVLILIVVFRLPQGELYPGKFVASVWTWWELFCNLALIQNLAKKDSILTVLWSLPYEMQMYIFLPWLFLFLRAARSIRRSVLLWMLSLAAAIFSLHHLRHIPDLALYIPCFMPGVIAYQLQQKERSRLPAFLWPIAVALLGVLYLAGASWALGWGGAETRWAVRWGLGLMFGCAVPRFSQLSVRWLVVASHFIAKYSYGIYLTHCFAIWLAFERMRDLPGEVRILVFIVSAIGLPILFYHVVEEPMIHIGKRLADRIPSRRKVQVAVAVS